MTFQHLVCTEEKSKGLTTQRKYTDNLLIAVSRSYLFRRNRKEERKNGAALIKKDFLEGRSNASYLFLSPRCFLLQIVKRKFAWEFAMINGQTLLYWNHWHRTIVRQGKTTLWWIDKGWRSAKWLSGIFATTTSLIFAVERVFLPAWKRRFKATSLPTHDSYYSYSFRFDRQFAVNSP